MKVSGLFLLFLISAVSGRQNDCLVNRRSKDDCLRDFCYWCSGEGFNVCLHEDQAAGAVKMNGVACKAPGRAEEIPDSSPGRLGSKPQVPNPQRPQSPVSTTDRVTKTTREGGSFNIRTCKGGSGLVSDACCVNKSDWASIPSSCTASSACSDGEVSCLEGRVEGCQGATCSIQCGKPCLVERSNNLRPAQSSGTAANEPSRLRPKTPSVPAGSVPKPPRPQTTRGKILPGSKATVVINKVGQP